MHERAEPERRQPDGLDHEEALVPGVDRRQYAIELLPDDRASRTCSTSNPVGTMLESSGVNTGSFRIRSTGFVGDTKASIVATFKRASLLDYIYFTQLETSDPVTYGYSEPLRGADRRLLAVQQVPARGPPEHRDPRYRAATTSAPRSSSSPATRSRARCTPTTRCRSAARRPSGASPADVIEVSSPPAGLDLALRRRRRPQLRRPVRDHRAGADAAADQRQAEDDRRAPTYTQELPDHDHPQRQPT